MTTINTYTLHPLTDEIDICWERQLLGAWHSAGLTDSLRLKMLKLYFGVPEWMDLNKIYPYHMFFQIAKGLKIRSTTDFLLILLRCKGFGLIWKDPNQEKVPRNLWGFYSPLWHLAKDAEMNIDSDDSQPQEAESTPERTTLNIEYNDSVKKNYNKKKDYSKYVTQCTPEYSHAEIDKKVVEDAKSLFNYFATDEDAYNRIVKFVNEQSEKILPSLFIDTSLAHPMNLATTHFFNTYLWPYVLRHSKQLWSAKNNLGRSFWIENLIKKDFMQQNIYRACTDIERQLADDNLLRIRQNRPISVFEYQDQESGQRFYDIPAASVAQEGRACEQRRIPVDAPPRPSGNAVWNKFAKEWEEIDHPGPPSS